MSNMKYASKNFKKRMEKRSGLAHVLCWTKTAPLFRRPMQLKGGDVSIHKLLQFIQVQ